MTGIDRRSFNKLLGGTMATLASGLVPGRAGAAKEEAASPSAEGTPLPSARARKAAANIGKPRVVIIGGGAGGASVASELRKSTPAINVTLVEPRRKYTSCFFSNHYLDGFRSFASLTHDYESLAKAGVKIVHQWARGINPEKKLVLLDDGGELGWDALVLSPGIGMKLDAIEGYGVNGPKFMPHAYGDGAQIRDLRRRLVDMRDGGTVVISIPAGPMRCPPAPYERATLIAHYLKYHKPSSKVIVLDGKSVFANMELFEEAWSHQYKGLIEWLPVDKHGGVSGVKLNEMSLITSNGDIVKGDVINLIPPQEAGVIARISGCARDGWCPVEPDSFASRLIPGIFVLGDAANASKMPKTASAAHSQAVVVANAIAARLLGRKMFPPRYRSTCWSLLGVNNMIKSGASYIAGKEMIEERTTFHSEVKETPEMRAATFNEAIKWYDEITARMFASE